MAWKLFERKKLPQPKIRAVETEDAPARFSDYISERFGINALPKEFVNVEKFFGIRVAFQHAGSYGFNRLTQDLQQMDRKKGGKLKFFDVFKRPAGGFFNARKKDIEAIKAYYYMATAAKLENIELGNGATIGIDNIEGKHAKLIRSAIEGELKKGAKLDEIPILQGTIARFGNQGAKYDAGQFMKKGLVAAGLTTLLLAGTPQGRQAASNMADWYAGKPAAGAKAKPPAQPQQTPTPYDLMDVSEQAVTHAHRNVPNEKLNQIRNAGVDHLLLTRLLLERKMQVDKKFDSGKLQGFADKIAEALFKNNDTLAKKGAFRFTGDGKAVTSHNLNKHLKAMGLGGKDRRAIEIDYKGHMGWTLQKIPGHR